MTVQRRRHTATITKGNIVLQAVMFDMDGLLVDSEPLWFQAESAVMGRLGGTWSQADQDVLVGGSMAVTVKYLLSKATRTAQPAEIARWLTEAMLAELACPAASGPAWRGGPSR